MISASYGQTENKSVLSTAKDSLSYALGVDISKSLKSSEFDIDLSTLLRGLGEAYAASPIFNEEESAGIIQQHFKMVMDKRNAALKEPGEKYLASLKDQPNIQATAEGLLYEVLTQGNGAKPTTSDHVKVHYAGYLIDGTKFDSSYDRGEPIELNLERVIQGWTIGVPLMNVGSKYKFYIPYHLAYGENGSGRIPPYSALIFEIELLDIIKSDEVQ
jgi:FKBP-type peptidyl-prolyl cis-trans isomerase FkpA/FKBP-type peptidyl-prolyl cis-trans isomerase FklB